MTDHPLYQFCDSDKQLAILERHIIGGESMAQISRDTGMDRTGLRRSRDSLLAKAAKRGYSPDHDWTRPVPDGHKVKGVSTYYDEEGKPKGQWVKSDIDRERQMEMAQDALAALSDDIPKVKPIPRGKTKTNEDLCSAYILTDYHLSMLAHKEETGEDWDLAIAEKTLMSWFSSAIDQAPSSETAVFAQLSDLLHSDGIDPLTPASKHLLDVDTRFYKVVRVAIRCVRAIIALLLKKHGKVHVVMADANHDPVSQIWLREWLSIFYESEPRVTVDTSPNPYNVFEFGKTALFFHHGHKRKPENISEVFAAQFREVFGRTKHAYAHMGHMHNHKVVENNLMMVEQHRTLAAKDAYAARGGYFSGRDAKVITYHRTYGEVGRVTVSYEMVAG